MESDAILYSNLSWIFPIRTGVMELRPADTWRAHGLSSYVVRYTNRYQRRPNDVMILAGADDAVDQFRLLTSFWFRAFFHPDRAHVELLCRPKSRTSLDQAVPRLFVPRFFSDGLSGTAKEADGLGPFVAKVLAMPRSRYRLTIACIGGFFLALEAIGTNFDLAYSLLVYVIEALSQDADGYLPAWQDYDPSVRDRLEAAFAQVDPSVTDEIKKALLGSAHLKLTRRFVGFVASHITDEFFTSEAEAVSPALPRSQLERALLNLYKARSGFVHGLKKVREQLRTAGFSTPAADVILWQHEPYFTLAGLVRLTHHVLATFVARQNILEHEDWPEWRSELPGLMRVELAPQYWIWQAEGFTPEQGRHRLGGLLAHLVDTLGAAAWSVPDMSGVMEKIVQFVPTCREKDRGALVVLYWVYQMLTEERGQDSADFCEKYRSYLVTCRMEMLAAWPLFYREDPPWARDECVTAFEGYLRGRHNPHALGLPVAFEIAIMAQVANLCLGRGDLPSFATWVDRAIWEAAGRRKLQEYLTLCKRNSERIYPRAVLGLENQDRAPQPTTEDVDDR
jgi:hypothetical protein